MVGIRPVWTVILMGVYATEPGRHPVVPVIDDYPGVIDVPAKGAPSGPPGRIILPAVGRSIDRVLRPEDILDNRPEKYIFIIAIVCRIPAS